MNLSEMPTYYYPNKVGRILLMAMREIMGDEGVHTALERANLSHRIQNFPPDNLALEFPPSELSEIQRAVEQIYGPQSGQGLALRSGRACFKYGLHEFGGESVDLNFRLLPLPEKLRFGANLFIGFFNQQAGQHIRFSEESDKYVWEIYRCPLCLGRHADTPVCHLAVGLVQESLYWISGGKYFKVEETTCAAKGDLNCTIEAARFPIE